MGYVRVTKARRCRAALLQAMASRVEGLSCRGRFVRYERDRLARELREAALELLSEASASPAEVVRA